MASETRVAAGEVSGRPDTVVPAPTAVNADDIATLQRRLPRALHRAGQGRSLTRDEAAALLVARGRELERLLVVALRVRDAAPWYRPGGWGRAPDVRPRVTYSRKVFVPLTHLCRDTCGYCTFAWPPKGDVPAYLPPEQVVEIARAGQQAGCKEVLFTLGGQPELRYPAAREWLATRGYDSTLQYLRAMAVQVIEATGLLAKGEAHHNAPDKDPAVRLRTLEDAGRLSVPFTSGLLVGIGETLGEQVDALLALREVGRRYGHLQEVIVQNLRAKPDTAMRDHPEPVLEELLAIVAVARVLLAGAIDHAQVSWVKVGLERVVSLLEGGCDDLGGTLMEETISRMAGSSHGIAQTPAALTDVARTAGRPVRERTTTYGTVSRGDRPMPSGRMPSQRTVATGS